MEDTERPETSIILPTRSSSDVIEELEDQLQRGDELLLVCDTEEDPIAEKTFDSEQVKVVKAGEPEGCSGKANAIHEGMREAENNRVLWTDDDFTHPENWLDQMNKGCDRYGAASELPFFTGKNFLTIVSEPIYAFTMLMAYLNNQAWGGSAIFDRDKFEEEKFLEELQQTVGDDVLLSEHLDSKTMMRTHHVRIDETPREALERIARFVKHVRYHEPVQTGLLTATSLLLATAAILYPIISFTISTLFFLAVYLAMGRKRPTFLLGYLSLIILPFFLLYGLTRRSFVWQGRRYRYNSKLDVEIPEK